MGYFQGNRVFFAATLIFAALLISPLATAESDEDKTALAQRIAELQRVRDFHQAEWDFQMDMMREEMPEDADLGMPEHMMEVLRQQQVEGTTEEWINALAASLDEAAMRDIVALLDRPEYQAWVDDQLAIYPAYLDGMVNRMLATGEVMMEDMSEGQEADLRATKIAGVTAVTGGGLDAVFEVTPGARIELDEALETQYFETVRVPASHRVVSSVFSDLEVELVPDGDGARVKSVSAQRGYSSESACDTAREKLERALESHFPDSELTDCGDMRYLADGGDTRMTITCREQRALGGSRLWLSVTHNPTQEAAFSGFFTMDEVEEEEDPEGEAEPAE